MRGHIVFGMIAKITRWVGVGGSFFDSGGENGRAAAAAEGGSGVGGGEGVAEPCEGCQC